MNNRGGGWYNDRSSRGGYNRDGGGYSGSSYDGNRDCDYSDSGSHGSRGGDSAYGGWRN